MSNDVVISVENLSKRYRLGQIGATSLRESAEHWWHKMRGRNPHEEMGEVGRASKQLAVGSDGGDVSRLSTISNDSNELNDPNYMWALKDVSFEVKKGEVLGIIGRNGAGKSTLLKILSRITEPTSGRAVMRGRVGSLLEVGTGFHPELSGRENIFLNGAILGMKRREVAAKFDEIVAFAEVDKFIDTPVKRYSSGMYVRLAFAVAAHLEPDILVVDEVLAVGDVAFQKKCLGKMGDIASEGRTILFVSHNMEAIRRLCGSVVVFNVGRRDFFGMCEQGVTKYLAANLQHGQNSKMQYDDLSGPGDDFVRFVTASISNSSGRIEAKFRLDESVVIESEFVVIKAVRDFHTYIQIYTQDGNLVFGSCDWDGRESDEYSYQPGRYIARCEIPRHLLNRGQYSVVVMGTMPMQKYVVFNMSNFLGFEVYELGGPGGTADGGRSGIVRPNLDWCVASVS